MNKKTRDTGANYTIVDLEGIDMDTKLRDLDLDEKLGIICTNKTAVEMATKIPYHRIEYLFLRKNKRFVIENNHMIIKTKTVYKGNQPGGLRNPNMIKRGNID